MTNLEHSTPMTDMDKLAEQAILDRHPDVAHDNALLAESIEPNPRPGISHVDASLAGRVAAMWRLIRFGQ